MTAVPAPLPCTLPAASTEARKFTCGRGRETLALRKMLLRGRVAWFRLGLSGQAQDRWRYKLYSNIHRGQTKPGLRVAVLLQR